MSTVKKYIYKEIKTEGEKCKKSEELETDRQSAVAASKEIS